MFNYKYLIKSQFKMIYYNLLIGYNIINHTVQMLDELLLIAEYKIKVFDDEMDKVHIVIKSLRDIVDRSLDSDIVEALDINKILYAMNTTKNTANYTAVSTYKIIECLRYLLQSLLKYGKNYSDNVECLRNSTMRSDSTSHLIRRDYIQTNQLCHEAIMHASDDYEFAIVKAFDAIAKTSYCINHMSSVISISSYVVKEAKSMLEKISVDIIKLYPVQ